MNYSLLAYLFICFSIGLVCLGVVVAVVHHTRSPVARTFLAFYVFFTVSVLGGLLLSFLMFCLGASRLRPEQYSNISNQWSDSTE